MDFLAGIIVAWAIVYGIIAVSMLLTYLHFGRKQEYFLFAAVCFFLLIHSVARAAHYLADDFASILVPGRIIMASLPLAAVAIFHLGLARRRLPTPARRRYTAVSGAAAVGFAILAVAGGSLDYAQPHIKEFTLFFGPFHLHEYRLTYWGTLGSVFSMVAAGGGCLLLLRSEREDRLVHTFFLLALCVLALLSLNDMLLAADLIRSVYIVEHGFMFMVLVVAMGFLREFERSRQRLREQAVALREANRHLEQLAGDLSESTEQLDWATDETHRLRPMADLGQLSASLAHEIRNPLAVLSNVASSLRRHTSRSRGSEPLVPLVEMLQEETDRLARLVDDLLLFSQTGRLSERPFHPNALVDVALLDVAKGQLSNLDRPIDTDVEQGLAPITGSMDGLCRALVNLIVNAVQSSDGDGAVRVIVRRESDRPGWIAIGVQDEAGGIPTGLRHNIFEPFFSTRPTGTGLGLPIVKRIVEAHGGTLELENAVGQGATFWMRIPPEPLGQLNHRG